MNGIFPFSTRIVVKRRWTMTVNIKIGYLVMDMIKEVDIHRIVLITSPTKTQ